MSQGKREIPVGAENHPRYLKSLIIGIVQYTLPTGGGGHVRGECEGEASLKSVVLQGLDGAGVK